MPDTPYPEGVTSMDHIRHDMKVGRFPEQSSVETFLAERRSAEEQQFNRDFDEAMQSPEALARDEAIAQRAVLRMADLERLKEEFVRSMVWIEATEETRSLVLGNLNGFVSFVREAWGGDLAR